MTTDRTEVEEAPPGYARRWWVLATMTVCLLVVIMGNTILNVALPTLQRDLGASQAELQWAVDAYILVFAGLLFSWGVIGDRIGRRRVLVIGLSIFAVGSVLASLSDSPAELIVWRAVMGVGGAAVQPTTLAVITNVFPGPERGRAIGVWAGTAGIAVAGGPLAGGAVLAHFWWGAVFLVGVPVAVVGIVAVLAVVPESKDPSPGRLDVPGVLLSIVALAGIVYGIIRGGEGAGWTTPGVLVPLVGGLALLVLFIQLQRRSTHPALDVSLFRNPAFSAAAGALGLNFFALLGATFYVVFYLQGVLGYTPLQAGATLIPVAVGMAVTAPRTSGLVERFGAKAVCATGFAMITTSFLGFQLLGVDSSVWVLLAILSVQGVGMGAVMAPATESIMSVVPREKAGAGAAVNNSVRQVGGALRRGDPRLAARRFVRGPPRRRHRRAAGRAPGPGRRVDRQHAVGDRGGAGRGRRGGRRGGRGAGRAGPPGLRRRHARHRGGDGGGGRDRRRRRARLAAGTARSGDGVHPGR
ncbi:MFS transporter [Blastococcus sp. TML/M2B]|uniref:MFS transporter n=1 Tax=Blastococcus sp. TML/M2B TaxID=2798727 RepID=UPI002815E074|nr:MFS transporter [Blastococcus sp. TML/M2B]